MKIKKACFWQKQEPIPSITGRGAVGGGCRLVDHRFIIPTPGGICKGECSAAPARKGPQGAKVWVKPFQRLAGPGQSPGRSRRSETPQDDYQNGRACGKGERPLRGEPLRRLRATPPLSGEAGLRAAFGGWPWGLLAQPFGGRFPGVLYAAFGKRFPASPGTLGKRFPGVVCRSIRPFCSF